MSRHIITALAATVCALAAIALIEAARSDPIPTAEQIDPAQVETVAAKVRKILADNKLQTKADPFPAYRVELYGVSGMVVNGDIIISTRRPSECAEIDLGHELAHALLGRDAGIAGKRSEKFARIVDQELSADPFRPNCLVREERIAGK